MLAAWNKGKERGQNTLWWSLRYFIWHTGANVFVKVATCICQCACIYLSKYFYVFVKVVVKERNKGKGWGQNTLWWSLRCFTVTYWTYHHCLAIYNIISLPPSLSLLTGTVPEVSWGSMKHVIEYRFGMRHHLALFLFTKKDNEELVGKAGQRISIGAYHCFLRHQRPHDQRLGTGQDSS